MSSLSSTSLEDARPSPPAYAPRAQACVRCHLRKRKCNRALPRCGACERANAECQVYNKKHDQGLAEEILSLKNRIAWLEDIVTNVDPQWADIATIPTGHALPPRRQYHPQPLSVHSLSEADDRTSFLCQNRQKSTISSIPNVFSHVVHHTPLNHCSPETFLYMTPLPLQGIDDPLRLDPTTFNSIQVTPAPETPVRTGVQSLDILSFEEAIELVKRYAGDHKFSHQVTSFQQLEHDAKLVYSEEGLSNSDYYASRFRLFIVVYLSGILGYKKTDLTAWRRYRKMAIMEVPHILVHEDLTCVQALTLLASVAIYESDLNVWRILGMATHTAIAINLHRKDEIFLPPYLVTMDPITVERLNEHRKNIFWTLYVLDRLVLSCFGYPPSIRDDDIDIDHPICPPTTGLNPSSELCHAIVGRRLLGQIHESLYSPSVRPNENGEQIVANFVNQVQLWYCASPLKAAFVRLSDSVIKRQCLDDMFYHDMMITLHQPSSLLPHVSSIYIDTLYQSACISLDLYAHYTTEDHVIRHWIHLHRVFKTCIVLIYCWIEQRSQVELEEATLEDILRRVHLCQEVLGRFSACPQAETLVMTFNTLVSPFVEGVDGAQSVDQNLFNTH
ncbi:transcription factor [Cryptococcus neoformans]|nr:transcription factor [Cryptococcus neoformans var. grubii]OXC58086.1 transcription factor [Cryptococcus neoformans var. grubii MW-RSA852]